MCSAQRACTLCTLSPLINNQAQHSRTCAVHWRTHLCVSTSSSVMPGQEAGSPTTRATRLLALESCVGRHMQLPRAASRWGSANGHIVARAVRGTAQRMAAFTQSSGRAGRSAPATAAGCGVPVVHAPVSSPLRHAGRRAACHPGWLGTLVTLWCSTCCLPTYTDPPSERACAAVPPGLAAAKNAARCGPSLWLACAWRAAGRAVPNSSKGVAHT